MMKTTLRQVRMIVREELIREEEAGVFQRGTMISPLRGTAPTFDEDGNQIGDTSDTLSVESTVEISGPSGTFSMLKVTGEDFLVSAADFKKSAPMSESLALKFLDEQRARKKALIEHGCGCAKCAQKATGRPYGMGAFMYDLLVTGEENELDEEDTVEES